MSHDAPQGAPAPTKLVIRNIGLLLSGALERPILDADTLVAENGRITAYRVRVQLASRDRGLRPIRRDFADAPEAAAID